MVVFMLGLISACLAGTVYSSSVRSGVSSAPDLDDGHTVQFFLVESSFPFNAPASVRDMAGKNFQKYAITHAGLGVWDMHSDEKFTIEFVSSDYVGALLPNFDDANSKLVWNNTGTIVFTTPTTEEDWLSAHMICETTGVTYNQLLTYLDNNLALFSTYQPVEAIYTNITHTNREYTSTQLESSNRVKVSKTDSFWFVSTLIDQLNSYGADTKSFLNIYANAYQYILAENRGVEVISWDGPATMNSVYRWYKELDACYQTVSDASSDAEDFLTQIKSCYGAYAYIYKSQTSVYNVTLHNLTTTYSTPNLQRYVFDLPPDNDNKKHTLQAIDIIVIVVAALLVAVGAALILKRVCTKTQRRRLSLDSEHVATRVVDSIAGEHLHDEHEQKLYYRGRPSRWTQMWTAVSGGSSKKNSGPGGNTGGLGGHSHNLNSSMRADFTTLNGGGNNSNTMGGAGSAHAGQHYSSEDSDSSTSDLVRPLAGSRHGEEYAGDMSYMGRADESKSQHGYVSPAVPGATHTSVSASGGSSHGGGVVSSGIGGSSHGLDSNKSYTSI